MILSFDYIGYKRLSENKRFPNHRWYSDATWGENGWMVSIVLTFALFIANGPYFAQDHFVRSGLFKDTMVHILFLD